MKILHTADIHLGDLAGPTKDGQNARRLDTIACMRDIVSTATDEHPHVTIIAGDLFNRSRVWADTALDDVNDAITEFIRPLCRCSEYVVLLFGTENHDNPRAFETLKEITANEPTLHICTSPEVLELLTSDGAVQIAALPGFDRGRLRLFAVGADQETENRNATALINDVALGLASQLDKNKPAILVAHYTVSGAEADNGSTFLAGQDVVVLPSTIDMMGVDLACFGHIHRPQRIPCNTPAYYCGSPNQLNFNDEGTEHGFYIHNILIERAASYFVPTPERRHYTMRLAAEDVAQFITTGELSGIPAEASGAVVRVRYSCTAEQEKAFNRAELQKRIMAAGAFYVAEVLPEDIEDTVGGELTEHDGPADTLARWMGSNGISGADADRLMELALPIIKRADDGRDASKHTGAFVPLAIEVKNYRSYTEAAFDFAAIYMAMVNGPNGVGKSSLFMDAIVDCLYEETRKEDVGGWVRDGTKSGAITFTFSMGGYTYRVVRTRTKTGRGTLALHRLNPETQEWEDEGDTTMRLTQTKIERLIGMDCNTFCSIALIRQDAYGLFLEADSDRRMEVLSALLGLDIYGRMEDIAKGEASEQRRRIAAAKERISVLGEQIEAKEELLQQDAILVESDTSARSDLSTVETAISTAQREEALRGEIIRQADEKAREAQEYSTQAYIKTCEADEAEGRLDTARELADKAPAAEQAARAVDTARRELEEFAPHLETLRGMRQQLAAHRESESHLNQEIQQLERDATAYADILARRDEITGALRELEMLRADRVTAEERRTKRDAAVQKAVDAKSAKDALLADSRVRIGDAESKLKEAEKKAALLNNSGCPVPETASCKFFADAVAARAELEGLREKLAAMRSEDKGEYERLLRLYDDARIAAEMLPDPALDFVRINARENELRPVANLAANLEVAQSRVDDIGNRRDEAQTRMGALKAEIESVTKRLPEFEGYERCAEAARASIREHSPLADTLPQCVAARATIEATAPQVERLRAEMLALVEKQQQAAGASIEIREKLPIDDTAHILTDLQLQRNKYNGIITEIAGSRGGIKARLETIAEAEQQAAEKRAEVEQIARVLNDYTTLIQAFGLDGIQYMVIRGIVPEIMRRANDILAAMTGGRMAVDIRTEKEQRSSQKVINSLEVWIASITGNTRPYQSHSGGEKVKIALAVTLGLADVKARRAGVQLGMLFIDEPPFLDADGTEAYADALTNMSARNPDMRILAISHDPTMKARFSQNIVVTAAEDGSVVHMEE